ncbi:MAG: hypothetical protein IKU57_04255 [Oscillospiraceae bacterium]|nr:hypothetical protein [Oscillospiraceae bacterium]
MKKNIRWITETAVLLALLICLQAAGSMIPQPLAKQLVTGTLVNCVLAVTVLLTGMGSGIVVALISPVCAFLLGIAPNLITVLPIMLGNTAFVAILSRAKKCAPRHRIGLLLGAAVGKFVILYLLVVELVCGIASPALLGQKLGGAVLLAPPMLKMLPTMFSWPQLVTALTGGGIALLIFPTLKKALHK